MNLRQDLCVLLVPELQGPVPERRRSLDLQVGESVTAIGYGEGYRRHIGEGQVTALYEFDGARVLRTTTQFPRGASGGGLFDQKGRLVGVLTFRATVDEELNYALPTEWVESLLETSSVPDDDASRAAFWDDHASAQPFFLQAAWLEEARAWRELHEVAVEWTLAEPDAAEAWVALGRAKLESGSAREAVLALRNAVARDANHGRAWYWLAIAYKLVGVVHQFVHARVLVERLDAHLAAQLQRSTAERGE
jgi:tetratricopeptide (TPR) repeat protein